MSHNLKINGVEYASVKKLSVPDTEGNTVEFITPTGNINITANGEYDVTEFVKAVVNVASGITPIGNLTKELIVRNNSGNNGEIYISGTIPAGYYVNENLTINYWSSGQLTGSGITGGTYAVPISSIGFIPMYSALIANNASLMAANTVLAVFGDQTGGRTIYTGAKASLSTTYSITAGTERPTCNENGITFPSISSTKYGTNNYRWFAFG